MKDNNDNIQFQYCEESIAMTRSTGMTIFFYFVCIITLGIYPLLSLYFPSMYLCFFKKTLDIRNADGLLLKFSSKSPKFYSIKKRNINFPLIPEPVSVLTISISGLMFYFDYKIKAFLRLGDFFSRKITQIESSSSLNKDRTWAEGLSKEEVKKLREHFGKSKVSMESYSFLMCILKTLKTPMIVLQIVGVIGFYLNHLWLLSAIQAIFLVYAIILKANRKFAKNRRFKSHSGQSKTVEVLRKQENQYETTLISSEDLCVGDVVILRNGLFLDSDLLVLRGTCMANETTFTGENYPVWKRGYFCLLYTSPSPRDLSTSRMPSSA